MDDDDAEISDEKIRLGAGRRSTNSSHLKTRGGVGYHGRHWHTTITLRNCQDNWHDCPHTRKIAIKPNVYERAI